VRSATLLLVASLVTGGAADAGATTSANLCPGATDPCTIACATAHVDTSVTLDFGSCDLVLAGGGQLRVRSGTVVGINARSLRVAAGGRLDASGDASTPGATLVINLTGATSLDPGGVIDVSGSDGGAVFLTAGGAVHVAGTLAATALGAAGRGALIQVTAGGPITVDAPIDTTGGTGDGGDIDLDGSAITVNASLTLEGSSPGGGGGDLTLTAEQGAVVVNAPLSTAGAHGTPITGGGNGGDITLAAGTDVRVNTMMTATGAGPDGDAGHFDISGGGAVLLQGSANASTPGTGSGGAIEVAAGTSLTSSAVLTATGGDGGDVDLAGVTIATVTGPVDVSSTGGDGDGGGITVTGNPVLVTSTLTADADTRRDVAGSVGLFGCGITLAGTGGMESTGINGANLIQGRGTIFVQGGMLATPSGTNRVEYHDQPPNVTPGGINPTATIVQNPAIPPCPGPIVTTTTTTSTTTTSSTSTSTSSVTTSSAVPTTQPLSTTTITVFPVTTTVTVTTSTIVAASTSTTVAGASTTTTSSPVSTSSTPASTTATTSTSSTSTVPADCTPPDCDDGDLCTTDSCVAGACVHAPLTDIDAITCRLDGLVAVVSATPVGRTTASVRERLLARLDAIRRGVERARTPGRRRTSLLGRADHRLKSLVEFVDKAVGLHRLDPDVGASITTLADGARGAISALFQSGSRIGTGG
jgi:hypothetical protein